MSFADAKQRFSNRVGDYVRYRPSYPSALVDLLRAECGLRPDHVMADVGSGTGILSRMFLENGNRVFGVEPNDEMRHAGEDYLSTFKKFSSIAGSAEATTLADASLDFVTVAQAFHWFEPAAARTEFQRILRRDGFVVIVWNDRLFDTTPFLREYEALLHRLSAKAIRGRRRFGDFLHRPFFCKRAFRIFRSSTSTVFVAGYAAARTCRARTSLRSRQ